MSIQITLPKYSFTAHRAAIRTNSPVAIVITMNETADTWEVRVWGKNDGFAYLAGLAADAALPAVNDMTFPPEVERTLDLLNCRSVKGN